MGTVCSRCRRGSASTDTRSSDLNPNTNLTIEERVQRPQSQFSLHNIDKLASDTNIRCREEDKYHHENGNATDCSSQRTSIENENASIDSILSENFKDSSPQTKRKSSFSDCSTNIEISESSITSSATTNDKSEVDTNTIEPLAEKYDDNGISNERAVVSPGITEKSSATVLFL